MNLKQGKLTFAKGNSFETQNPPANGTFYYVKIETFRNSHVENCVVLAVVLRFAWIATYPLDIVICPSISYALKFRFEF